MPTSDRNPLVHGSNLKQKENNREKYYEATYKKNPINPTVVQHLFNKTRTHLIRDWTGGIEQGIERGWLIDE